MASPTPAPADIVRLDRDERIKFELAALYAVKPDSAVFTDRYIDELKKVCDRQLSWEFGIVALQAPAYLAIIIGFLAVNPSAITLFGISLSGFPGLREFLLLYITVLGAGTSLIDQSRSRRSHVHSVIVELKHDAVENSYLRLINPDGLYIEPDFAQSSVFLKIDYAKMPWNYIYFWIIAVSLFIVIVGFKIVIEVTVFWKIISSPQLPILAEVIVCFMAMCFWLISAYLRFMKARKITYIVSNSLSDSGESPKTT